MSQKLIILHDSADWLEPIKKSLDKLNVNYEDIILGEGVVDLEREPEDAVYFNRVSPSSHLRGKPYSIEHAINFIGHLNNHGRKVINNLPTQYLELNKFAQYTALVKSGIAFPKTIAAFGKEHILGVAEDFSYPLILKPNRGGSGDGVEIFHSYDEVKKRLDQDDIDTRDGVVLVQEYIKPKDAVIYRSEFIGGEYVYTVKIRVDEGFNLCPADVCNLEMKICPIENKQEDKFTILKDYKPDNLTKYQEFVKQQGYDIAGIEFVVDESGKAYTYDINANTNYNGAAEEKAGISAYDALAKYLKSNL